MAGWKRAGLGGRERELWNKRLRKMDSGVESGARLLLLLEEIWR